MKGQINALWFYGCNFIAQWSPIYFGHSRAHLQGGENKNTKIIKMGINHSGPGSSVGIATD